MDLSVRPGTFVVWVAAAVGVAACADSDPVSPADRCDLRTLPLVGSASAPTVEAVSIEIQSSGLVLLLTATDPQGTEDLVGVVQQVGVYPDETCVGPPVPASDDLACSGCEESFGTVVSSGESLYQEVAVAETWPVMVTVSDVEGNTTSGNVAARVVR